MHKHNSVAVANRIRMEVYYQMQSDRLSLVVVVGVLVRGCVFVYHRFPNINLQISYYLQAIWITIAANGKNMYEIFNNMITIRLLRSFPFFHSVCFLLVASKKSDHAPNLMPHAIRTGIVWFFRLLSVVRMSSSR